MSFQTVLYKMKWKAPNKWNERTVKKYGSDGITLIVASTKTPPLAVYFFQRRFGLIRPNLDNRI